MHTWSTINPDCDLCSSHYDDIVIDDFGRVWIDAEYGRKKSPNADYGISQGYGVDVFIPHWGQSAERVRRYTRDNSGYQHGIGDTELRRTDDGRIWTADHRLVWIDASNSNLPTPLPDWFANLISIETVMKVNFLTLGIWVAWMAIYWLVSKVRSRSQRHARNS